MGRAALNAGPAPRPPSRVVMRKLSGDARKSPRYSGPRRFRMASSHRRRKKARIPPSGRNANVRTCGCHLAPRQNRTAARGRCRATLAMGFMAMFKKKDPKDLVREWQSKMRTEMRGVDRQIRGALASRTSRRRGTFPRRRLRAVHGRLTTERARWRSARRAVFATNTTRRPRLPTDGP